MTQMTAFDPPTPMPWLCRLGLHARSYSDTSGTEVAKSVFKLRTVPRCNRCNHETGEATFDVMVRPNPGEGS